MRKRICDIEGQEKGGNRGVGYSRKGKFSSLTSLLVSTKTVSVGSGRQSDCFKVSTILIYNKH